MRALHLGALWAFAFVQPLFDLLGGEAQFFVARGSTTLDIVLFAVVWTVVPPLVLALVKPLHTVFVGILCAAIVLPHLGPALVALPLAALVGAGAAYLYRTREAARTFLTVLSPAPLLFLALFLFASPVAELVLPEDAQAAASGTRSDTPVVMVVFDELPATSLMDARDRVDARRFPAFAAFARDATWYREASTVSGRTTEAIPALLTGDRPHEGDLPIAADHPGSLFTLLRGSHELHVVEPITDVCPADLCPERRQRLVARLGSLASDLAVVEGHVLLPEDLSDSLPPIDGAWEGFGTRREFIDAAFSDPARIDPRTQFDAALGELDRLGDRPPLLFVHLNLPHIPWTFLPDGTTYAIRGPTEPGLEEGRWTGPQWLADQNFQRHLVQTEYADHQLGRLLERLRAEGLYDRALIVVAADHGVSFRGGDRRRRPTPTNVHDVANMPLFVKLPGQAEGEIVDGVARTIDVLPTIAEALGIEVDVDGVPLGTRGADPATELDVPDSWEGGTTTTFGEFLSQRAERRERERALLGAAGYDPYRMGPRPDLVGTRPRGEPVRAELDSPLPYVEGTIEGVPDGAAIAVAVDGRIAATTRVDGERFAALVDPAVRGDRIAVYEI